MVCVFELWQSIDVVNDVKDDVAGNLRQGIRQGGDDLFKPINGNQKRRRSELQFQISIDKVEAGVQKSAGIEKF